MAELARRARPWLLLSSSLARRPTPPPPVLLGLGRHLSTTAPVSATSMGKMRRASEKAKLARQQEKMQSLKEGSMNFLLPHTLVAPPLRRYPRAPAAFLRLAWLVIKNRTQSVLTRWGIRLQSWERPVRNGPRFRFPRGRLVPTARALHARMSEALADGDREALRAVCCDELYARLAGVVDARPRGQRVAWELVRYERPRTHPRLADVRAAYMALDSRHGTYKIVRQAVVTIASEQRIARYYRDGGALVPGSARVDHLVEHVVLQSVVNMQTYKEIQPWKVWGTLPESTYDKYVEGAELYNELAASARGQR